MVENEQNYEKAIDRANELLRLIEALRMSKTMRRPDLQQGDPLPCSLARLRMSKTMSDPAEGFRADPPPLRTSKTTSRGNSTPARLRMSKTMSENFATPILKKYV